MKHNMIEIETYSEDITCIKTGSPMPNSDGPIMWAFSYKLLNTLFDTGCANAKEEVRQYLEDKIIDAVYISHSHEDHSGCVDLFEGRAPVYAWKSTVDVLREPPEIPEFFKWAWGQNVPFKEVQPMPESFEVGKYHFDVVELPGHGNDMVGFYEPDYNWLFSADAVPVPTRKYIAMPDENLPRMILTLERLQTMDIEILFDSHRGPIESPREHIQNRIDYLKDAKVKVRKMHEEGLNYQEIMERLDITPPWYVEMTADRFAVKFFIESLIHDSP